LFDEFFKFVVVVLFERCVLCLVVIGEYDDFVGVWREVVGVFDVVELLVEFVQRF